MVAASTPQISLPPLRARCLPRPGGGARVHPERLGTLSSLPLPLNIPTFKLSNLQTILPPSPFPVYPEPRRARRPHSCAALNCISLGPLPNSHRIIFFAHPHPLTPIESYSCKNKGKGAPAFLQPSNLPTFQPPNFPPRHHTP